MSDTLITVLEDFLCLEDIRLDGHVRMYAALATEFRTVLLTTGDRMRAQRITKINRIRYDLLLSKDDSVLTNTSWKVAQVREVMGMGWPIGMYLDVDPDAVRAVYAMGLTSLLLTHRMLRPSWLPSEGPPRAWEDLVAFQEAQEERTADVGGDVDEVGRGGNRRRWTLDE